MNTVVVGFDGTDQAADALALGAAIAGQVGAELLLGVVDDQDLFAGISQGPSLEPDAVVEQARAQLGEMTFEAKALVGSVPECLEVVAADAEADLLVVGSSRHGTHGSVVPGSVGERLLAGSPCAIAVAPIGYVREHPEELRRVGVGVDGEEEAAAALRLANELAVALGGSLRLISVVPVQARLAPGRPSGTAEGYAERVRAHLAGQLEQAQRSSSPTLEVAEVLIEGDAATTLCEQSRELDLLVLGSRGYGPLRRVLLGATASKVIRAAVCPVLVTPRAALRTRRELGEVIAGNLY